MKVKLLSYLLIFTAFIALYQFVSTNKYVKKTDENISHLLKQKESWKVERDSLLLVFNKGTYFNLQNNEDALNYYDHLDIQNLEGWITDKLIDTNIQASKNELIPYESERDGFRINKIKVLNHRWIIADFSDGAYWGELLLQYYISDSKEIEFITLAHFIYPTS